MSKYDYDLIVIGGGSGGLAAAKEAAKQNPELKVACFDYVEPTPHGTKWGIGGTCVNVGCIPKKLMHYTAQMSHTFSDGKAMGWGIENTDKHDWPTMVGAINMYIKSLNFSYKSGLRAAGVKYINAAAKFKDDHTVEYTLKGEQQTASAEKFIVAVGGRPTYPDIPGAELAITSDDIFWRKKAPGKTLVVGGSYIALECGGFLHDLGYDTTIMVRSILLRGFDQQVANQIGEVMEREGVRFINPAVPTKLERKDDDGPISVTYKLNGNEFTEEFDTVLLAIGRTPQTKEVAVEKAGVKLAENLKVIVNDEEQTSVPHIYALGDIIVVPGQTTRPELTPVAIQAGQFLARRLYGGSTKKMDYNGIPTTVFTPVEYGAVGMSFEEAQAKLGKDNVDAYVSRFNMLESAPAHREGKKPRSTCFHFRNLWVRKTAIAEGREWEDFKEGSYEQDDQDASYYHNNMLAKLVIDKTKNEKVVGFHYVGPNAGEMTQGFALAVKLGATKADFDDLVGIHPTLAEEFTVLDKTLSSGDDFMKKEGCGGGGSCG